MSIRNKLFAGFFAVLVILVGVAGISWTQISTVNDTYSNLIDDRVTKLMLTKDLKFLFSEEFKSIRGYIISSNEANLKKFEEDKTQFDSTRSSLEQLVTRQTAIDLLNEIDIMQRQYIQIAEELISLKRQNDVQGYIRLIEEKGNPLADKLDAAVQALEKFQQDLMDQTIAETTKKAEGVKKMIIVASVLGLLLGAAVAYIISRMISIPVALVAKSAKRIEAGDLTVEDIQVKTRDEIGEMALSFNAMKRNLRELLKTINQGAEQVAASSEELYAGSEQAVATANQVTQAVQEISSSTDHQMISMDENKKAMEESAVGLQRIAESASMVAVSSGKALQDAEQGNRIINKTAAQMEHIRHSVQATVSAIQELADHSEQIGRIVQVISDIAKQTNLLSLNASIEAARAGENGKGFAVVAGEVNKLAEQCKQSSDQIAQLIQGIQSKTAHAVDVMDKGARETEEGTVLMKQAGGVFLDIFHSIQQVTGQIEEVSAATEQISAGTQQLLASEEMLGKLSTDISMNAQGVAAASEEQLAAMEEISASADSLSQLALQLQSEVSKFKI